MVQDSSSLFKDPIAAALEAQRQVKVLEVENTVLRAEVAALKEENKQLRETVGKLTSLVHELTQTVSELKAELAQTKTALAKAKKNSSNSSKPPSSDMTKPKRKSKDKKGDKKRKPGGQPGHPKHQRPPFPPEQIDERGVYGLQDCPCCGEDLVLCPDEPDRIQQQMDLNPKCLHREEHACPAFWCASCEKVIHAPMPGEVARTGWCGERLLAMLAFLKGACHMSYTSIRKFMRDVMGQRISRGELCRLIGKVNDALEKPYLELLARLPLESVIHADETGHKEKGKRMYTWVFRTMTFMLFRIESSRGSQVLIDTLGEEFDGVLGCDYFSAYRKFMKDFDVRVQFCLAHLIRDVKYLTTLDDRATRAFGEQLRLALKRLFRTIHKRDTYASQGHFRHNLNEARRAILNIAEQAPHRREAQNIAARFEKHGEAYFEFITTPEIEPTNNLAEQAIRFVVIDRKITQGTRCKAGRKWSERIWTAIGTLTLQGRSVLDFMREAIEAYFKGTSPPSLLPQPS